MAVQERGGTTPTAPRENCVLPTSKVLCSTSGVTKLAKDIKEGQSIAYYNKDTDMIEMGTVSKVYVHKDATDFVKYMFSDGTYLEATDYHPIYTKEGWKSLTRRNGYPIPIVGDKVKTQNGWKTLTNIEQYKGLEDCYDFAIRTKEGNIIDNYFANSTLVQSSL